MTQIFTKSDFNSSDGMLTSVWGPSMWHFLHTMSFNYPIKPTKQDKINYENYLLSLQKVLPCKHCRDNFFNNLSKVKFSKKVFKNRDTFSKFIYDLHEEVNEMLGKKSNLTYDEAKIRYEHFRARCLEDKNKSKQLGGNKLLEKGCVDSLYGKKSKCVLNIVPKDSKIKSFKMSPKCKIDRLNSNKCMLP
tara:strand:+ start:245 stop:814 length:570 start_codon:yes stop_codon:yes gene_type:complete